MKKLFLLAGVVAAMISCAKSDVYDVNESNPDVITVGAYVDQTTKGTIFTQESVKASGFGLMAYNTGQPSWAESEEEITPNFMYNQEVTYTSSTGFWNYSPLKYWPNADNDKVTFFSYAPYQTYKSESSIGNGVNAGYTANNEAGIPQIQFFVNPVASDMIDFVAGQNMDMVRQQEKVIFNLKHQLTRVTFSAKTNVDNVATYNANATGDGDSYIVVKSMNIVGDTDNLFYTKGVYTFATETTNDDKTDHDQDGTWTIDPNSASEYSLYSILDYNNVKDSNDVKTDLQKAGYKDECVILPIASSSYTSLFTSGHYLFLLPPNGKTGLVAADGTIDIQIVYDIVSIDDQLDAEYHASESTYTISLPAGTLAQGKAYDFQLTFDVSEVLVEPNIVDWDTTYSETESGTIDPYDDSIYNPIEELEIGLLPEGDGDGSEDDGSEGTGDSEPTLFIDGYGSIYIGQSITLSAIASYEDLDDIENSEDTLSWSVVPSTFLDKTINEDGTITLTGVAAGESTVTITSKSGVKYSVTIEVIGYSLNITNDVPEELEVDEIFTPAYDEDDTDEIEDLGITWSSSNPDVVSVDPESGEIKAIKPGKATITAKDKYGNIVYEYDVTVPDPSVDEVEINLDGIDNIIDGQIEIGESFTPTGTISPEGTNTEIVWSVSNDSDDTTPDADASINNGVVSAGDTPGTFILTATAGDEEDSITIEVVQPSIEVSPSATQYFSVNGTKDFTVTYTNFITTEKTVTVALGTDSYFTSAAKTANEAYTVTATAEGTDKITFTPLKGDAVSVDLVASKGVVLTDEDRNPITSGSTVNLYVNGTYTFTAAASEGTTFDVANESDTVISYAESAGTYTVTGLAVGESTMTFTDSASNVTTIRFVVSAAPTITVLYNGNSYVDGASHTTDVGEKFQLTASTTNADGATIKWSSNNPDVATIDDNGEVTVVSAGKVTFTATIDGTEISDDIYFEISTIGIGDEVTNGTGGGTPTTIG